MANTPPYTRPTLSEALSVWKTALNHRNLPVEMLWAFDENLCFERDPAKPDGFRLGFQTVFTPPPPGAEEIAFHYFSEFEAPVVFYRLGSCGGKSICLLLCDGWFDSKGEAEGYFRREDWRMAFHPGTPGEVEEITDKQRWEHRIIRDRPLHALDFCMTLRAVHETLAHGRVLTTYERYALRFVHAWGQWLKH